MHNAVLKFKIYITQVEALFVDTLIGPLSVLFLDHAGHFGSLHTALNVKVKGKVTFLLNY
jgi:hypothetical protein